MQEALGSVETRSLIGAIEAADVMLKTSNIRLIALNVVGSGIVAAVVKGDVASVTAAVESGARAASRLAQIVAANVIPNPMPDVEKLL